MCVLGGGHVGVCTLPMPDFKVFFWCSTLIWRDAVFLFHCLFVCICISPVSLSSSVHEFDRWIVFVSLKAFKESKCHCWYMFVIDGSKHEKQIIHLRCASYVVRALPTLFLALPISFVFYFYFPFKQMHLPFKIKKNASVLSHREPNPTCLCANISNQMQGASFYRA